MRKVAELTGFSAQVTAVLADTYRGPWIHAPGAVFADLAAAVAASRAPFGCQSSASNDFLGSSDTSVGGFLV